MAFNKVKKTYRLGFIDPILASTPNNKQIFTDFVASKAADQMSDEMLEEELNQIPADETIEKGTTVFKRNEAGEPILNDYMIRGFFKSAAGALRTVPKTESSKVKAYKKEIDLRVSVSPRNIIIQNHGEIGINERPLRAQTMQGERVSLARSEEIQPGAFIVITVELFEGADNWNLIEEWLDFGAFNGIGQWRNSGKGSFVWDELDADGKPITHRFEEWLAENK